MKIAAIINISLFSFVILSMNMAYSKPLTFTIDSPHEKQLDGKTAIVDITRNISEYAENISSNKWSHIVTPVTIVVSGKPMFHRTTMANILDKTQSAILFVQTASGGYGGYTIRIDDKKLHGDAVDMSIFFDDELYYDFTSAKFMNTSYLISVHSNISSLDPRMTDTKVRSAVEEHNEAFADISFLMKSKHTMTVVFGEKRYDFSLKGSSKAISKVLAEM